MSTAEKFINDFGEGGSLFFDSPRSAKPCLATLVSKLSKNFFKRNVAQLNIDSIFLYRVQWTVYREIPPIDRLKYIRSIMYNTNIPKDSFKIVKVAFYVGQAA